MFWEFKGTSKVKSFSSCHTHFSTERLFLNLSDNAPSLFVRHSCVPELIMVVFKRLNCFNLLLFIISLTEVRLIPVFFSTSLGDMLLPGFSSCEQISAKWHQLMRRWKSLWIKNLRVFKQYNELNRRMKSLQCKIRRRRKKTDFDVNFVQVENKVLSKKYH